jgi:hypothetical protein
MSAILKRIERESGVVGLIDILADKLNPQDLQSLLLEVARRRAEKRSPAQVLADFSQSRFYGPSQTSPMALQDWDRLAFGLAEGRFEPLELSPVAPLGACSSVALVDQMWSVPTARRGEVMSDPTNILALEAARRRKGSTDPVHLAASPRVVRPQAYHDSKLLAHFRLFALVSAGRVGDFEGESLARHLEFYFTAFAEWFGANVPLRLGYTISSNATGDPRVALVETLAHRHGAECVVEADREAVDRYYKGFCFHIYGQSASGEWSLLVDGGAVDWTAKLLGNAKERALVSGAGVERLVGLRGTPV